MYGKEASKAANGDWRNYCTNVFSDEELEVAGELGRFEETAPQKGKSYREEADADKKKFSAQCL